MTTWQLKRARPFKESKSVQRVPSLRRRQGALRQGGRKEGYPNPKEAIMDVATSEFSEHGFAGGRVDRIGSRAGVSKGVIYYHFGSKRNLYQKVLRRIYTTLISRLSPSATLPNTAERLATFISEYARLFEDEPRTAVLLLRELCEGGKHIDHDTLKEFSKFPRILFGILDGGIRNGSLRDVPLFVPYYTILAPIHMFAVGKPFRRKMSTTAADYGSRFPSVNEIDEFAHNFAALLMEGLSSAPSRAQSS
jgi:AcrR family transcriptional regulator